MATAIEIKRTWLLNALGLSLTTNITDQELENAFYATVPFNSPGSGSSTYVHTQGTPSASWNVNHNLGTIRIPIIVLDSEPTVLSYADYEVIDLNTIVVNFDSAVSGKAYV